MALIQKQKEKLITGICNKLTMILDQLKFKIALLTEELKTLTEHFKENPKRFFLKERTFASGCQSTKDFLEYLEKT